MQPMRRQDRMLSYEEGIAILKSSAYGVLAFKGPDMYPHAIPMSFALQEDTIYFHSALEGYKMTCLDASSACCFTVIGKTQIYPESFSTAYESCVIYGTLEIVPEERRTLAFEAILSKYSPQFMEEGRAYAKRSGNATAILGLKISHMTVKGRK